MFFGKKICCKSKFCPNPFFVCSILFLEVRFSVLAQTSAPVAETTSMPEVSSDMCKCVADAGLCEQSCDAYAPALSTNQQCMDAFVNVVCKEGVDGTFFGTPYYMLCPNQCLSDCLQHSGDDEATIRCLKRRVDVLEGRVDANDAAVSRMEGNVTDQCQAVNLDVEKILKAGCPKN